MALLRVRKPDGSIVDIPAIGGGSGLNIVGAKTGQVPQICEVDENGVPTAWAAVAAVNRVNGTAPDESGNVVVTPEETWQLLADITLEEETKAVEQRWFGTPARKIMLNVSSLAADSNANYMPITIYTTERDNADSFNVGRFYPDALPRTTAVYRTYIAEVFMLGKNAVMKFTEYQCGVTPSSNKIIGTEAVKTASTYGNDLYAQPLYEQITGIEIHTYGSFAVGTRFTFWGVAK